MIHRVSKSYNPLLLGLRNTHQEGLFSAPLFIAIRAITEGQNTPKKGPEFLAKELVDMGSGKIHYELSKETRLPFTVWQKIHNTLKPNDFKWFPKERKWSADISPVSKGGISAAEKYLSEVIDHLDEINNEEKEEANSKWVSSEDSFLQKSYPNQYEKVVKESKNPLKSKENIPALITSILEQAERLIPEGISRDKLLEHIKEALEERDGLSDLTTESIQKTALTAAALGLSPSPVAKECFFIPFKDNLVFIIGYRGLMELSRRADDVLFFDARCVYKNDAFELNSEKANEIWHVPHKNQKSKGEISSVYAIRYLKNGEKDIAVLSHKDLRKFLKKSKNNNPVWTDWSEEMSTKTLIKMLTKQNELSNEKKG